MLSTADLKILVVEDDDFQRSLVVKMLRSLNAHTVLEAANGSCALEVIRSERETPVNIVLCDLNMPEMDGMAFLRHLAGEAGSVSVIITSALEPRLLSSVSNMAKMYGLELLGTLEKPLTLERLRTTLLRHGQTVRREGVRPSPVFELDEILEALRKHQFVPYFQPKVHLAQRRLSGAEVLVRWVHPTHGLVGPLSFIPQLEQNAMLDELTCALVRDSADICRSLLGSGKLSSLSFNLSVSSLGNTLFADKLSRIALDTGIDARSFVFEVTESAAMTEVACVVENLSRLAMKGFALSIDDYGTGYSSMQQLTRIPFHELKIDRSFVHDCTDNDALGIIVSSSIDMAHKLRMECTAEGVETRKELNALIAMGCDIAQGYFIAKPMPFGAFEDYVRQYRWH